MQRFYFIIYDHHRLVFSLNALVNLLLDLVSPVQSLAWTFKGSCC